MKLDTFFESRTQYAPLFIRIGLATVFLLFGLKKLIDPSQTTAEIQLLAQFLTLGAASAINYYMGLFETLIAIFLFIGYQTRRIAFLAGGMVAFIFASFIIKYRTLNPDISRDIGLLGGALALLFWGAGPLSLDQRKKDKENPTSSTPQQ